MSLPLHQMKARDFAQAAHAMRYFWLGFALLVAAWMLGGCMQTFQSSVAGSCGVFERPPYVVLGKTRYDQDVADKFVESGVAGCNWRRPAPRPASLDASPVKSKAAPVKPKRGFVKRITEHVKQSWPSAVPAIEAVPAPPAPAPVIEPPAPPPKPRSAIDQLLHPDAH